MSKPTNPDIVAVVLAAGSSRRFGADKRRHLLGNTSLLQQVVAKPLALGLPTLLVLRPGDDAKALSGALGDGGQLQFCYARSAAQGMGHSLASAVASLEANAQGVLVMLADMPWVDLGSIAQLLEHFREDKIIVPSYQGHRGHPVLFSSRWFSALQALSGDRGARQILRDNPESVVTVAVDDRAILLDVDLPEDVGRPL